MGVCWGTALEVEVRYRCHADGRGVMEDRAMTERETHSASPAETPAPAACRADAGCDDTRVAVSPLVTHLARLRVASRPLDVCVAVLLDAAREERAGGG